MAIFNINPENTETVAVSLRSMSVEHWKALKVLALSKGLGLTEMVVKLIEEANNENTSNGE